MMPIAATNVAGVRVGRVLPGLDIPDLPGSACKHTDPEVFHPSRSDAVRVIAKAKSICGACPVRRQCLDWCLEWERKNGERQGGIWGGVTEWERPAPERVAVKAQVEMCRNGLHEMVGENIVTQSSGARRCRECKRKADQESKDRRAATAELNGALLRFDRAADPAEAFINHVHRGGKKIGA